MNNFAPFIKCITKIEEAKVDDVEHFYLVMAMNNFLVYSYDYSDKRGSLWFHSKDEATNFNDDTVDSFKFFKYKTKSWDIRMQMDWMEF